MRISTSQSDLASVSSTMTNDNSAETRGYKAAKGSTQEGQPGRKLPPLMRTRSKSTSDLTGKAGARKAEEENKSTEERGSLVRNRRLQLTRRLSQGRVEVPEGEQPQQKQQPKNADGLVANRRRHFTRRMSTGNASCGCPTSGASRNNNSSNGSFSSLPGGAPRKHLQTCKSFPNTASSEDLSGQRVATLRERFNSSMSTLGSSQSTLDIGNNSSHHSLYGRASGHGSCHSIAESSIDDDDDSSVGSFGQDDDDDEDLKEEGSSFALHFSSGALELKDDEEEEDEEDNLKMESSKSKNNKSFNSSFLTVGGSGKDCLQTGRGSIFVIGDSRLGNTKVIQSKLNKSATKIQRFFRYSMAILSLHREEIEYHRESLKDVERRRQEELEEVQRMLEIQKQQFLLQMEYETRGKLEEKLERNHKLLDEVEEQLEVEQKERAELGASILKLKHENLHLKYQSNDPELEDKMKDLKASIQLARLHRAGYKETYDNLKIAVGDYEARILVCKQETDKEQHKISVLKKYLDRIMKLVPSSLVNGSSDKDGHADEVAKATDVAPEGVCEAHAKKESTTAKDVNADVKADAKQDDAKAATKKTVKKEPKASKKQRRASSEKKRESITESANPLMEIITGAAGSTADQSSSKSRDRQGSMAFTESTTSLTGSRGSMSMHNSSSALLSLIEVGGGSVSVSSGLALGSPELETSGSKSKSKRSSSKSDKDKKDKDKKEKKDKKKSSRRSSSTDSTSICSKKSSSKSTSGNGKSRSSSKSKRSSKTTKRHSFDSALGQLVTG